MCSYTQIGENCLGRPTGIAPLFSTTTQCLCTEIRRHVKNLNQSFLLKAVINNVSDLILQYLCSRYSGRVNIKMMKPPPSLSYNTNLG